MLERLTFERELAELAVYEVGSRTQSSVVSFVLTSNFGLLRPLVEAAKLRWQPGGYASNHSYAAHGFEVHSQDDAAQFARLKIIIPPLWAGAKDHANTIKQLATFAKQLEAGCAKAHKRRIAIRNNAGKPVEGAPRPFEMPKARENVPIARLPLADRADPRDGDRFERSCTAWAQPLVILSVPLWNVQTLIDRITATDNLSPTARTARQRGLPLTGPPGLRSGRRSDALLFARQAVLKERKELLARKLVLSDGKTKVDERSFSKSLTGFLILLASYLWSGLLFYDKLDYETDPEAYLPLAVKAPFSEILRWLESVEQDVFRELFAKGDARLRLFRLANHAATRADGVEKLLPPGPGGAVHKRQQAEFGTVPTWDDLVDHTLDRNHNRWGDRLLVVSRDVPWTNWRFAETRPDVALALRRIPTVDATHWPFLMRTILKLTTDLGVERIDI